MQMLQTLGRVAPLVAALLVAGPAGADQKVDLKVARVALFSSGVGFFEAETSVEGPATAELRFRTDQINDLLKSLVVQDLGGGTVGAVSYAARDPVEKSLRSFGVDITGKPTLAQLLEQLRGEPVEISGANAVKGKVLGVEVQSLVEGDQKVTVEVVTLLTDGGLTQVRLRDVSSLRFSDPKIDGELRKALETLAASHDADKKSVVLSFDGQGLRKVRASYLLEAPVWKTSYRLVLTDGQQPFLQGWAVVENATEEDWNNVRLSLVAGRPISFTMDLYTPIYIPRPREELERYASLRPPEYEGGVAGEAMMKAKAPPAAPAASRSMFGARAAGRGGGAVDADGDGAEETERFGMGASSVESVAEARDAGELFEYVIRTPVTLARQHSAMLPIVNQAIEGTKLSIYNPASHPKHPLNGLELKNSSGLHLMQGPVTVFDGSTYAGDAKLPDVRPDEKRLIAYALDLGTEVIPESKPQPTQLVSLRIAKGTLWRKHKHVAETVYTIKNKVAKPRTLLLELAYNAGWTLVEPREAYEKTAAVLRFRLEVPASQTVAQRVVQEYVSDEAVALGDMGPDDIAIYVRGQNVSPKLREALEKVVALRAERDNAARRRMQIEQQLNEAITEQARIRENLKTLEKNTDVAARQMKKFDALESQIEQLRTELDQARQTEETRRAALEQYLLNLTVE